MFIFLPREYYTFIKVIDNFEFEILRNKIVKKAFLIFLKETGSPCFCVISFSVTTFGKMRRCVLEPNFAALLLVTLSNQFS